MAVECQESYVVFNPYTTSILFSDNVKNPFNPVKFRYKITTNILEKKPLCILRKDALKKTD
jgi:hypothetical protein